MIGIILAVIIGIVLIGAVLHLLKFAIIVAVVIGGVMLVRNHLGNKRLK